MTRPVTVFEWWRPDDAGYKEPFQKREIGAGNFHQFGLNCVESDQSIGTYTSAIVEMPDGHVKNVDIELIRFDDA
jgi:hypothetical protein